MLLIAFMSFIGEIANAQKIPIANADGITIYYKIVSNNQVELVTPPTKYTGNVVIPPTVSYKNKNYQVTAIGAGAFMECIALRSVTIPNSVMLIDYMAFTGCTNLTSIVIPNSVREIGTNAFASCSSLSSITIPNSITKVGNNAFNDTEWYNKQPDGLVYIGKVAHKYKGVMPANTSIIIKKGTVSISFMAFARCDGLVSITIPNSVTSIDEFAFENCSNLKSVNIPNGVKTIENGTFSGCSSLTKIIIPNSVTYIYGGFDGCTNLTSITIPNSVKRMDAGTFSKTAWLKNQPDGLVYIGKVAYAYKGVMPKNTSIRIKEGTLVLAGCLFSGCSNLTSITIPNSVITIGYDAFRNCTNLTSVVIPNGIKEIETDAFQDCSNLTSASVPNSIIGKIKGQSIFRNCYKLKAVKVRNANGTVKQNSDWYWFSKKELPSINNLPPVLRRLVANMVSVEGGSIVYHGENKWVSSFSIGKYEVTLEEWEAVMGNKPNEFKMANNLPVESVSWHDCNAFIKKLNQLTGMKFRLPKDLEWYYAARGGNKSRGLFFAGSDLIHEVAYYDGNSNRMTHKVGEKKPNELGLYDMSGNVWEWCEDYSVGALNQEKRIVRGGSYRFGYNACKVYDGAQEFSPSDTRSDVGFRLVLDPQ